MDYKSSVNRIKEQAFETILQEREESQYLFSLRGASTTFRGWKRWYLKKNQKDNYARLLCRKPDQFKDVNYFWVCRLQLFQGEKLLEELKIEPEVYLLFPANTGWGELMTQGEYEYRIYRNPEVT